MSQTVTVRQQEITRAIENVRFSSSVEQYGLVLGYYETTEPERHGFSLITPVIRGEGRIAVYAESTAKNVSLRFTGIAETKPSPYGTFIAEHLAKTATLMEIGDKDFFDSFVEIPYLWRFHGYVDKEVGRSRDNDRIWRPLWDELLGLIDHDRFTVDGLEAEETAHCAKYLRHHAIEGRIVLVK